MRINNNIMALNAHRQLGINQTNSSKSMERLSSGLRINRAGDDAAGLSISEKMRGQIRGLKQASRNAQDGISLIQTAEGALNETHSILQRMRELVVQAGNLGTQQDDDLSAIQKEIDSLVEELGYAAGAEPETNPAGQGISNRTEFNGKKLLDGSFDTGGEKLTFQIGANTDQAITMNIKAMGADTLGTIDTLNDNNSVYLKDIAIVDEETGELVENFDFDVTLKAVDDAIKQVSEQRSALGAMQNRLEHTIANLDNASENLSAAESRIRDVDMAAEMMEFTKNNILQQAATAMLAQANMAPQSVLQLLG